MSACHRICVEVREQLAGAASFGSRVGMQIIKFGKKNLYSWYHLIGL